MCLFPTHHPLFHYYPVLVLTFTPSSFLPIPLCSHFAPSLFPFISSPPPFLPPSLLPPSLHSPHIHSLSRTPTHLSSLSLSHSLSHTLPLTLSLSHSPTLLGMSTEYPEVRRLVDSLARLLKPLLDLAPSVLPVISNTVTTGTVQCVTVYVALYLYIRVSLLSFFLF